MFPNRSLTCLRNLDLVPALSLERCIHRTHNFKPRAGILSEPASGTMNDFHDALYHGHHPSVVQYSIDSISQDPRARDLTAFFAPIPTLVLVRRRLL